MSAPTTWSHSQLQSLFECGEKYRLEKVARAPRLPAWWFVSGTAFHRATEKFDRALYDGIEWSDEQIVDAWTDEWLIQLEENRAIEPDESKWMRGGRATKAAPNKEDGEYLFDQGVLWVVAYRQWRLENPHLIPYELPDGQPAIEVDFAVTIAGQLFRGGIDRVFVDTNTGLLLVVDLKAGASKPENDDQLSEYKHAMRQLFGVEIEYGAYYMAREGRLLEPAPLSLSLAEFEKKVRGATVMRENKVYVPRRTNRCKTCGVNRYCAAYGGADAVLYEGIDE